MIPLVDRARKFAHHSKLCYKPRMRDWVRERMRRRGKKAKNESESTGKVGQEKPPVTANQPAPLQPSYYTDPVSNVESRSAHRTHPRSSQDERMQIMTQPESPSTPPASADEILKQPTVPTVQTTVRQERRARGEGGEVARRAGGRHQVRQQDRAPLLESPGPGGNSLGPGPGMHATQSEPPSDPQPSPGRGRFAPARS